MIIIIVVVFIIYLLFFICRAENTKLKVEDVSHAAPVSQGALVRFDTRHDEKEGGEREDM